MSGKIKIPVPQERRKPSGYITIRGARENNLKILMCRYLWYHDLCYRRVGLGKELIDQ